MEEKELLEKIEKLVDNKPDEWACKIKKVSNGFVIEYLGCESYIEVVKEDNEEEILNDKKEVKAMEELLWNIKEYFGVTNSKHNKFNLVIRMEETKFE